VTDLDGPELTPAALLRAVRAAVKRGGCIVTARARADAEEVAALRAEVVALRAKNTALKVENAALEAASPARPEWVKITGPADVYGVTVRRVYRVIGWKGTAPVVNRDDGRRWNLDVAGGAGSMVFPTWEPCDPAGRPVGEEAS